MDIDVETICGQCRGSIVLYIRHATYRTNARGERLLIAGPGTHFGGCLCDRTTVVLRATLSKKGDRQ